VNGFRPGILIAVRSIASEAVHLGEVQPAASAVDLWRGDAPQLLMPASVPFHGGYAAFAGRVRA